MKMPDKDDRKRRKEARQAAKGGGKGASLHGTARYTPAELKALQAGLSGTKDVSTRDKYKAEVTKERAKTGESVSSSRQRTKGQVRSMMTSSQKSSRKNKIAKGKRPKK